MPDFSVPSWNLTVPKQCLRVSRNYSYSVSEDVRGVREASSCGRTNKIFYLKQGFSPRHQEASPWERKTVPGGDSFCFLTLNNKWTAFSSSLKLDTLPLSHRREGTGRGTVHVEAPCYLFHHPRHIHTHTHTHHRPLWVTRERKEETGRGIRIPEETIYSPSSQKL